MKSTQFEWAVMMVVGFIAFMMVIGMYTGKTPFTGNTYQTYAFQAESWTHGRLDLEENFSWLEIAEFNGKYYCSFPPFPSYVLFPFAIFCGHETPDAFILFVMDILALVYLFRIAIHLGIKSPMAAIGSLGIMVGTNMVFINFNPAVWFFAQSICFALATMAIYYALVNRPGLSLAFWACSVGCRPMQAVYVLVLLLIIWRNEKANYPDESFIEMVKRRWKCCIPAVIIAVSYMLLNYFRFGSITEFGHNYLPEFVIEHKQFSTEYISRNFDMLMHFPDFDDERKMYVDHFGNLSMLMVNTPVIMFLLTGLFALIKKEWKISIGNLFILVSSVAYLILTTMHATMGGWHFGNRYSNDILPFMYLGMMWVMSKYPRLQKWQIPFYVWGTCLNMVGTVIVYNGLGR